MPARTKAFELIRKELGLILERDVLAATLPNFPIVRRMTLVMNSPLLVQARKVVERPKKCSRIAGQAFFHSNETKINSWTDAARVTRGSLPTEV